MPDASADSAQQRMVAASAPPPRIPSNIENGELFYGGVGLVVTAITALAGFVVARKLGRKDWELPIIAVATAIGGLIMMVLAFKVLPVPSSTFVIRAMPALGLTVWVAVIVWAWGLILPRLGGRFRYAA